MKIIHLAKYYLPHLGGVEIHLKELNSLLVKEGHQVIVFAEEHDLKLSPTAEYDGVKIIRIPKEIVEDKKKVWKFFREYSEMFAGADIIHVHDVFWWILPVYKLVKKKVYITFHGWETQYPVALNAKIGRWIYSKMAKGTIHVGAWIQDFYFDKPDFITYGAINPKRLTKSGMNSCENSSENDQKHPKELCISFVGRLSNDNDLKKYIELIKLLKLRGNSVKITWVGDGEYRNECEKLGEVTGFVKNVSKYLVEKDFVFSSSYLSILEAQLLGNIVCSFYSNDLKKAYLETFPGQKYMLIAKNAESMFKKISFILSSPKSRIQTRDNASKFAKSQTWKKVLGIYQELWGISVQKVIK